MKDLVLSDYHQSIGGKMVDFAGYFMPVQYEGVNSEHNTVRTAVGVFDVSHMGEIFVSGVGAEDFLQYVTTNDVRKLIPGRVQYSCMPNSSGGIVDDLLVYKIQENEYMLVVNASNLEKDWRWLNDHSDNFDCYLSNQSDEWSLLAVQGPDSLKLLQEITEVNLSNIEYYHFCIGRLADIYDIIISRTGYTGELGFELYVRNKDVRKLWDALFSTSIEIKPVGLAARDTLRLEKGFCLYGNDINETTSPIEAGLSWITKFNKEFVNSEALFKQKQEGTQKRLVGMILKEKGIARKDYPILNKDGSEIGVVTSGTMSPTLQEAIAMGYVYTDYTKKDTELYIQVRKKRLKAKVVSLPFVK